MASPSLTSTMAAPFNAMHPACTSPLQDGRTVANQASSAGRRLIVRVKHNKHGRRYLVMFETSDS